MESEIELWQVGLTWVLLTIPFLLFDLAAIKWGAVTSGDRGGRAFLEV